EGVTGVIGQVLTLVTGAAAANGFHGLGGAHCRCGLLHYNAAGVDGVRLRRDDTGDTVEVQYNPRVVPADPEEITLLAGVRHRTRRTGTPLRRPVAGPRATHSPRPCRRLLRDPRASHRHAGLTPVIPPGLANASAASNHESLPPAP